MCKLPLLLIGFSLTFLTANSIADEALEFFELYKQYNNGEVPLSDKLALYSEDVVVTIHTRYPDGSVRERVMDYNKYKMLLALTDKIPQKKVTKSEYQNITAIKLEQGSKVEFERYSGLRCKFIQGNYITLNNTESGLKIVEEYSVDDKVSNC